MSLPPLGLELLRAIRDAPRRRGQHPTNGDLSRYLNRARGTLSQRLTRLIDLEYVEHLGRHKGYRLTEYGLNRLAEVDGAPVRAIGKPELGAVAGLELLVDGVWVELIAGPDRGIEHVRDAILRLLEMRRQECQ